MMTENADARRLRLALWFGVLPGALLFVGCLIAAARAEWIERDRRQLVGNVAAIAEYAAAIAERAAARAELEQLAATVAAIADRASRLEANDDAARAELEQLAEVLAALLADRIDSCRCEPAPRPPPATATPPPPPPERAPCPKTPAKTPPPRRKPGCN